MKSRLGDYSSASVTQGPRAAVSTILVLHFLSSGVFIPAKLWLVNKNSKPARKLKQLGLRE
jgi:hypothetical protein